MSTRLVPATRSLFQRFAVGALLGFGLFGCAAPGAPPDEEAEDESPIDDRDSDEGGAEAADDDSSEQQEEELQPANPPRQPIDAGGERPVLDASMPSSGPGAQGRTDGSAPTRSDAQTPDDHQSPSAGGFPKSDMMDTNQKGPYQFSKYTMGLTNPTYASAVLYHPTDAPPPYPAVVFSPGFTATKEQYEEFLGPLLASHGIIIMLTTPTTTGDFPNQRADDLKAALDQVKKENEREGSPVKGKIATDRMCVTGHSMGGGGTLWAANELRDKIRCAVPLQPWQPGQSFAQISAPTMFIAAENDTVAGVSSNAATHYRSIPASVPKFYVEFAGASHYLTSNSRGSAYDIQSRYMISFYKRYLEDDKRYDAVLLGEKDPKLSKYEHTAK